MRRWQRWAISLGAAALGALTAHYCRAQTYDFPICRASDDTGLGPGDFGYRHALNHDWYKDLAQPDTGGSCCNGTTADQPGDCRPTFAKPFGNTWKVLIDGEWEIVPPNKIVDPALNKEWGVAHVCAGKRFPGVKPTIYCFIGKRTGG